MSAFNYQLLSRLQADCKYYLNHGRRDAKHCLWAQDEKEQIAKMKELWNGFPEDGKPEWITMEQIEIYERRMLFGDNEQDVERAEVVIEQKKPNCYIAISYMYRDASNYKFSGPSVMFECFESPEVAKAMYEKINNASGEEFIPEEIGLESYRALNQLHSHDDHCFHELVDMEIFHEVKDLPVGEPVKSSEYCTPASMSFETFCTDFMLCWERGWMSFDPSCGDDYPGRIHPEVTPEQVEEFTQSVRDSMYPKMSQSM